MVELLLARGADASLKDAGGNTALDEAMRRGQQDVAALLRQHQDPRDPNR
jgi:ankyrin repeat protein